MMFDGMSCTWAHEYIKGNIDMGMYAIGMTKPA